MSWAKKEIQRLCCFRIDDDDDGPKMLNINFVFKLSNCFISLTLNANKKPLRTTNQRPVSRSRDHSQPIRGQYPVWTMSCNSPCVLMFTG